MEVVECLQLVPIEKDKNVAFCVGEAGSSSLPAMRYMIKIGWGKIKIGERVIWFAGIVVYLRMSKLHFSYQVSTFQCVTEKSCCSVAQGKCRKWCGKVNKRRFILGKWWEKKAQRPRDILNLKQAMKSLFVWIYVYVYVSVCSFVFGNIAKGNL